jgi:hypothetical protein
MALAIDSESPGAITTSRRLAQLIKGRRRRVQDEGCTFDLNRQRRDTAWRAAAPVPISIAAVGCRRLLPSSLPIVEQLVPACAGPCRLSSEAFRPGLKGPPS